MSNIFGFIIQVGICVKCGNKTDKNILVCETCVFNSQVNEASKIFNCHSCKKDFSLDLACSHATDIIKRNKGKFAWDDLVMCSNCCDNPKTWTPENIRRITNNESIYRVKKNHK